VNEHLARVALLSNIEGGHTFWSAEISTHSALTVYNKLLNGGYDSVKYEKLISNLRLTNADKLLSEIDKHYARLVTPADEDWPEQLKTPAFIAPQRQDSAESSSCGKRF
jgi:predicted Rossmann fold nucleotide-binding protein DprA/Smf involved in DNA uptake